MRGRFYSINLILCVLIVFSGIHSVFTPSSGWGLSVGKVEAYDYDCIRITIDLGERYTGSFFASKFPIEFFIIDPEDLGPNWSYSIDTTYERKSGMNGTFYFEAPYPGEWLFCCYNPNPENQSVKIKYTYRGFGDDVQLGTQVCLYEALVVGIAIGGWKYRERRRLREKEADIFSDS